MQENDQTLLQRYAEEGAQDAFAEVVRRNINAVYSVALRCVGGDAHLAKDASQDVFIALARHAEAASRCQVLTGWLHRAAHNSAANRVRTEVRRRRREQEACVMNNLEHEGETNAIWEQVSPLVDQTINQLNLRDRQAILLRFFDQRTFDEIGAALKISEDGARLRVDRALEKLRSRLEAHGVRSVTAALNAVLMAQSVGAAPAGLEMSVAATALGTTSGLWAWTTGIVFSLRPTEAVFLAASVATMVGAIFIGHGSSKAHRDMQPAPVMSDQVVAKAEHHLAELNAAKGKNDRERTVLTVALQQSGQTTQSRSPARSARLAGGRRAELAANYNNLYQSLGLTAEQIDQFETVLLRGPAISALWIYDQPAPDETPPALEKTEVEKRLRELMGEEKYREYQSYNRLLPAKTIVAALAGSFYQTEAISRENCDRLASVIAAASASFRTGDQIDVAEIDWDFVAANAGAFLSTAQLAGLDGVRRENALLLALDQRRSTTAGTAP